MTQLKYALLFEAARPVDVLRNTPFCDCMVRLADFNAMTCQRKRNVWSWVEHGATDAQISKRLGCINAAGATDVARLRQADAMLLAVKAEREKASSRVRAVHSQLM